MHDLGLSSVRRAFALADAGLLELALCAVRHHLSLLPDDADALGTLSEIAAICARAGVRREEMLREGLAAAERAAALTRDSFAPSIARAALLYEKGDKEQAIVLLRAADPRFADDPARLFNLGLYYVQDTAPSAARLSDALALFRRGAELYPDDSD